MPGGARQDCGHNSESPGLGLKRIEMRRAPLRYALLAAVLVIAFGVLAGVRTFMVGKAVTAGKPVAALILVYDQGKVAKVHRLTGSEQLDALEAFFPGYQGRPTSAIAAGWKRGYDVYFDFPDGYSIRLAVSSPRNRPTSWSAGRGDFEVRGDFHEFTAGLPE